MSIRSSNIESDVARVSELLAQVSCVDATYPPQVDDVNDDLSRRAWLQTDGEIRRWVAEDIGRLTGHVLLATPAPYLTNHLTAIGAAPAYGHNFAEIAKLFVDPSTSGRGLGRALLETARAEAWSIGMQPTLAVVSTSQRAIGLYQSAGLVEVSGFHGRHGENRVFVDVSRPTVHHPGKR